jgi:hypothetical protein
MGDPTPVTSSRRHSKNFSTIVDEVFRYCGEADDGGDKIICTRGETIYGEVEIIHGGGKASDSMHVLIHGGFIVEVEPKTKLSAAVVKLAMAEMKSHNGWRS